MREPQLRRGQGPLLRPTRAQVRQGSAWVDSPQALAALDKRILYPPARWPEELDDRTSAPGRVRLTFQGDLPGGGTATLLLRVRVGSRLPECTLHGPVTLLGHNADRNGWHPATIQLDTPLTADMTVELDLNARVSRALLGRI